MRLFLAIDLPKDLKEYIFNLESKFKEAKITWVSKKNLHLTLKFFGDVKEENIPKIIEKLKIKQNIIKVHLTNIGFFPNEKDPRVIWIGLEPENEIILLQQKLDSEFLEKFSSDQKFQAHITLGRIKSIRRREDFFKSINAIQITSQEFEIKSFQLMKSELTKNGPIYETIDSFEFSSL